MEEVTALFGGKPGEPVPQVDPDDLKAVWEINHEVQTSHPGERVTGISVLEHACKPGADVKAVAYRAMILGLRACVGGFGAALLLRWDIRRWRRTNAKAFGFGVRTRRGA